MFTTGGWVFFLAVMFTASVFFFRYMLKNHLDVDENTVAGWAFGGEQAKLIQYVAFGIIALPAAIVYLPIHKIKEYFKKKNELDS